MLVDFKKEVKTLEDVEAVYKEYGIIPKNTPEELIKEFKDKREKIKEEIKEGLLLIFEEIKIIAIGSDLKEEQEKLFPLMYKMTELSKLGWREFKEGFEEIDYPDPVSIRIGKLIFDDKVKRDWIEFKGLKEKEKENGKN
jgi:hypothetical protein